MASVSATHPASKKRKSASVLNASAHKGSSKRRKYNELEFKSKPAPSHTKSPPSSSAPVAPVNVTDTFLHMDATLLADYVAQRIQKTEGELLSTVEIEDKTLPVAAFKSTIDFEHARNLEHFPEFLETFKFPTRQSLGVAPSTGASNNRVAVGAPHTIVVCSSALRVCDVARALRSFQTKQSAVVKLFAKHVKLSDAITHLKKTQTGICAGTPSRINNLIDAGALSLYHLEQIIIDASNVDKKNFNIFDMKDVQKSLITLLNRDTLKSRYGDVDRRVEILFY